MASIKIATFNVEWMVALFNGDWNNWDGTIPASFPGKSLGGIRLDKIDDVPALCERIAGVIKTMDAKIIGIQEGPPLKSQMEHFVSEYLNDDYAVHSSNPNWQGIHALVHKSIANKVTSFDPDDNEVISLRSAIPFYPWGTLGVDDRKKHKFARIPLVLTFQPSAGKKLRIIVVHTKSKFSKLKRPEQWFNRDAEAITDALLARQKLSAEIYRLREFILEDLNSGAGAPNATVAIGDFNDGAYAELIEREFLIHNIVDELVGSFLTPDTYFKHAMTPATLSQSSTVSFPDPLENGAIVEELIDHVVLSPSIWQDGTPFKLKSGSCKVEKQAHTQFDDTGATRERGLRPSDHKPVSFILEY